MNMFSRFMNDESGATAIEYGLIAAIVAVGIITALRGVSSNLISTFNKVGSELSGTGAGTGTGTGGGG